MFLTYSVEFVAKSEFIIQLFLYQMIVHFGIFIHPCVWKFSVELNS